MQLQELFARECLLNDFFKKHFLIEINLYKTNKDIRHTDSDYPFGIFKLFFVTT